MHITINKGTRLRAQWFSGDFSNTCLAGVQLKIAATQHTITGTVRHIRSNDPEFKIENCVIFIEPDDGSGKLCEKCGVNEIEIKPQWICEILST